MTTSLKKIETQDVLPESTSVVIIGGGVVGVSAALTLAERNIPVVLLEKGHIAGEQSSRNLGWIRKTNRHLDDVPLAQAADKLWNEMPERIGQSVGYKQSGIMFLAKTDEQQAMHENWLKSVESLSLDSRLLNTEQIKQHVPGGQGKWAGALYTPSDGYAEPSITVPAMAQSAIKKGATIIQHCAVRSVSTAAGKVSGVITEKGEIRCDNVLLAGGAWSRRFLGNLGVSLPTLGIICSVLRTKALNGPTDIAVGGPDFSFRKHSDGGFIITQRGKLDAPLTLDHLLVGRRYLAQLRTQRSFLRITFGPYFFKDLAIARRWRATDISPFEKIRAMNPSVNTGLNADALNNLSQAWPVFNAAELDEAWAGLIDVTPDSNPVIDQISQLPGLTIATGFSGHGFGTGPAAGQLAADIVSNSTPLIDPSPYRFGRL